ncbi:ribonuclease H2 [Hyaloraphidium curvatum]|nr:ribonuclease H2 [Hyaloraphidium curvatum]
MSQPRRSKRRRVAEDDEVAEALESSPPAPEAAELAADGDSQPQEDAPAAEEDDSGWAPADDPSFPLDPVSHSFSYYSDVPPPCRTEEVTLGVDEAGRGPVLGPMVYACAYMPSSRKEDLKGIGFADSKTLTDPERVALFKELREKNGDWIGWANTVCSPKDISNAMLQRSKYNLNALAHDTTIALIRGVIDRGVRVSEVFIDTVGPPDTYQQKLSRIFPGISITVSKKADSLYPVVSAASICAKVPRDRILARWSFAEPGLDAVASRKFGSGYPGDPNTVAWLARHMDPVFGYPILLRFSWSTCDRLLEEKAINVVWPDYENAEEGIPSITQFFQPGAAKDKVAEHPKYFKDMKLKRVENLFG